MYRLVYISIECLGNKCRRPGCFCGNLDMCYIGISGADYKEREGEGTNSFSSQNLDFLRR